MTFYKKHSKGKISSLKWSLISWIKLKVYWLTIIDIKLITSIKISTFLVTSKRLNSRWKRIPLVLKSKSLGMRICCVFIGMQLRKSFKLWLINCSYRKLMDVKAVNDQEPHLEVTFKKISKLTSLNKSLNKPSKWQKEKWNRSTERLILVEILKRIRNMISYKIYRLAK